MENYEEIKKFLFSKTNKVYITILSTLCFVLPLNSYFLNLNIVNVNFVFAGAIFVAIGAAIIFKILKWYEYDRKWLSIAARIISGICLGFTFYVVWISAAAKFTDHIEITNGKTTQYFYRGELYHTDNNDADAVWYGCDKNNYRVTFVYADGKKVEYINGKKI